MSSHHGCRRWRLSCGNIAAVLEHAAPWFDALRELLRLQAVVAALVLGLLAGSGLRLLLLLWLDKQQSRPRAGLRLVFASGYVGLLLGYFSLVRPMLQWDMRLLLTACGATLLPVIGLVLWRVVRGTLPQPSLMSFLLRVILVLLVIVLTLVSVMRAGFLNLTTDRPLLLLELSGETRPQSYAGRRRISHYRNRRCAHTASDSSRRKESCFPRNGSTETKWPSKGEACGFIRFYKQRE